MLEWKSACKIFWRRFNAELLGTERLYRRLIVVTEENQGLRQVQHPINSREADIRTRHRRPIDEYHDQDFWDLFNDISDLLLLLEEDRKRDACSDCKEQLAQAKYERNDARRLLGISERKCDALRKILAEALAVLGRISQSTGGDLIGRIQQLLS